MNESENLALLRLQRHSFLNHLQVIGGWLQLGQADRASAYVAKVAGAMVAEREALAGAPPALSIALLEIFLQAEMHGVHATIQVAGSPAPESVVRVRAFLTAAVAAAQALPVDRRAVRAHVAAERLTVQFPEPVLLAGVDQPAASHETALP